MFVQSHRKDCAIAAVGCVNTAGCYYCYMVTRLYKTQDCMVCKDHELYLLGKKIDVFFLYGVEAAMPQPPPKEIQLKQK